MTDNEKDTGLPEERPQPASAQNDTAPETAAEPNAPAAEESAASGEAPETEEIPEAEKPSEPAEKPKEEDTAVEMLAPDAIEHRVAKRDGKADTAEAVRLGALRLAGARVYGAGAVLGRHPHPDGGCVFHRTDPLFSL